MLMGQLGVLLGRRDLGVVVTMFVSGFTGSFFRGIVCSFPPSVAADAESTLPSRGSSNFCKSHFLLIVFFVPWTNLLPNDH